MAEVLCSYWENTEGVVTVLESLGQSISQNQTMVAIGDTIGHFHILNAAVTKIPLALYCHIYLSNTEM